MPFHIVSREDWGATPITVTGEPLKHPINWVNMAHLRLEFTADTEDVLLELQRQDRLVGKTDIQPNFIIAEDGVVYEGMGWFIQPANANEHEGKEGLFLDITYLGDLEKAGENYQHPVYDSLRKLLSLGVHKKYLDRNARFVKPAGMGQQGSKKLGFLGMSINMLNLPPPSECLEDKKPPE